MRLASFAYDTTYPGQALPVIGAEFRSMSGSPGTLFDQVIVDTGPTQCVAVAGLSTNAT